MTDDESRQGVVDLAVLGNYRLVNLAGTGLKSGVEGINHLLLAALCDRKHAEDGPFLVTVGHGDGVSDNLAELAWAATDHEAEHHDGDRPYLRYEVGEDLERLYRNTSTLWHHVDLLAHVLRLEWDTADPGRVLRAAAYRLGLVGPAVEKIRANAPHAEHAPPAYAAILDAVAPFNEVRIPDEPGVLVWPQRCPVLCPRDQAEAVAMIAGVHRIDGDWQCYLAPHTGDRHTVRPTLTGHLYHFTAPGAM